MPPVGFEPTISAGERPKTYDLDRAATGTGLTSTYQSKFEYSTIVRYTPLLPSTPTHLFDVTTTDDQNLSWYYKDEILLVLRSTDASYVKIVPEWRSWTS